MSNQENQHLEPWVDLFKMSHERRRGSCPASGASPRRELGRGFARYSAAVVPTFLPVPEPGMNKVGAHGKYTKTSEQRPARRRARARHARLSQIKLWRK